MERVRVSERMDERDADARELDRSLEDLRRVNRWLGGRRSAIRRVLDVVEGSGSATILDVGTGGADLPIALVKAARRRGVELRILATDVHPTTVRLAREATRHEPAIEVACADALALPFAPGSFDIVMCCTTLHHFSNDEAVKVLREMGRVARRAVVVTDLARSRLALIGAYLLAGTVWARHPITRHDGPVSVKAAFTTGELALLATAAFGRKAIVRRQPLFRLSLVLHCA